MKLFGRELEGFPKALVVLASVLLVSTGLCALTNFYGSAHGFWASTSPIWSTIVGIGAVIVGILILTSAAGVIVVLISWPLDILYRRIAKPDKHRQRSIFDAREDDEPDDKR